MTRYAIDAAALLHLVTQRPGHQPEYELVAPNWLRSLAMELLFMEVSEGRRSDREAKAILERITEVKVRLLGDRVSRRAAWDLARERQWTSLRDAEYLAVARLQADALVKLDPDLETKAQGLVPLAPVDVLLT